MELISAERRNELILSSRTRLKLELRDRYAVDSTLFDAWRRGDAGTVRELTAPAATRVAAQVADGVSVRRIKVLSEPPSDYMRHMLDVSGVLVEAGEDIRWLPRRLASNVLLPANDFNVLDGTSVVFNVLDGDDSPAEQQLWTSMEVVNRCVSAFEDAWEFAIPHRDYLST
ncbi:hypothetical protein CLV63_11278 [Murinocardiopsis flavida]|uniref:DUF6879 domain-containing protein n=1 Tax=Murinocardiopsis flavida TaxID=645275 RepID=A0A2P8DG59_9ACTN|nr:DUF6879 family protein [Murinocardiopsis flavida]PSK96196.1 hypothetical protein CLV63_11278 [Murinocardiopsis flavida]